MDVNHGQVNNHTASKSKSKVRAGNSSRSRHATDKDQVCSTPHYHVDCVISNNHQLSQSTEHTQKSNNVSRGNDKNNSNNAVHTPEDSVSQPSPRQHNAAFARRKSEEQRNNSAKQYVCEYPLDSDLSYSSDASSDSSVDGDYMARTDGMYTNNNNHLDAQERISRINLVQSDNVEPQDSPPSQPLSPSPARKSSQAPTTCTCNCPNHQERTAFEFNNDDNAQDYDRRYKSTKRKRSSYSSRKRSSSTRPTIQGYDEDDDDRCAEYAGKQRQFVASYPIQTTSVQQLVPNTTGCRDRTLWRDNTVHQWDTPSASIYQYDMSGAMCACAAERCTSKARMRTAGSSSQKRRVSEGNYMPRVTYDVESTPRAAQADDNYYRHQKIYRKPRALHANYTAMRDDDDYDYDCDEYSHLPAYCACMRRRSMARLARNMRDRPSTSYASHGNRHSRSISVQTTGRFVEDRSSVSSNRLNNALVKRPSNVSSSDDTIDGDDEACTNEMLPAIEQYLKSAMEDGRLTRNGTKCKNVSNREPSSTPTVSKTRPTSKKTKKGKKDQCRPKTSVSIVVVSPSGNLMVKPIL